MILETRTVPLEIREIDDKGRFDGHASIFGVVDSYNTIFDKGSFKKTLQESKNALPLTLAHDWRTGGIGMARGITEDDTGLHIAEGRINLDSTLGREVYVGLPHPDNPASGYYRDMSHSFDTLQRKTDKEGIEHKTEVRSYEIGIVMANFGSTPGAGVEGVRAGLARLDRALGLRDEDGKREAVLGLRAVLNALDAREDALATPADGRPYPNEHSCRLLDPSAFERFIRKTVTDSKDVEGHKATGKQYALIIGYRADDTTDVQAHRYPKGTWSADQAKAHCSTHGGKSFEAAKEEEAVERIAVPSWANEILQEMNQLNKALAAGGPSRDTRSGERAPEPGDHSDLLEEMRAIGAALHKTLDETR